MQPSDGLSEGCSYRKISVDIFIGIAISSFAVKNTPKFYKIYVFGLTE